MTSNYYYYSWLWASIICMFIAGCRKPDDIGGGLIPTPNIQRLDNLQPGFQIRPDDSLRTSGRLFSLVGSRVDPLFGRTSAEIFTQFLLSGTNVDFTEGGTVIPIADSIFLNLVVNAAYGRHKTNFEFQIHELTTPLKPENTYYITDSTGYDNSVELSNGFRPTFNDTFVAKEIKIPLNINLANKLLLADVANLRNNGVFMEFFKGLRIGMKPVNAFDTGAIFALNLTAPQVFLRLHYSTRPINDPTAVATAKKYDFIIPAGSVYYHRVVLSERSNFIQNLITQGQNAAYLPVEALGGLTIRGKMPELRSLYPLALNRAVLFVPLADTFIINNTFPPPPYLSIFGHKADSVTIDPNRALSPEAIYNPEKKGYEFVLTGYVQNMIFGNTQNYGFAIVPYTRDIFPYRGIINASGIRLELFYTQF